METPEIGPGSSEGATTGTAGEYYMFLITNYSNSVQDFVLEQTGGTGTSSQSIVNGTGIHDAQSNTIEIFPNPAKNWISISGLPSQKVGVEIIDITGKTVITKELSVNSNKIDVSDLNQGIYILKYEQNNMSKLKKFIIK
jgi:hypothetical protein